MGETRTIGYQWNHLVNRERNVLLKLPLWVGIIELAYVQSTLSHDSLRLRIPYAPYSTVALHTKCLLLSPSQKPSSEPCTVLWTLVQKVCRNAAWTEASAAADGFFP